MHYFLILKNIQQNIEVSLKEVQFLTENRSLPITIQQKLLKAKFLILSILNYNLTNTIQKFKVKSDITDDNFIY